MKRFLGGWRTGCALTLAILIGAPSRAADEPVTDIVLVIDLSGSMKEIDVGGGRKISFVQLQQRLQQFIDEGLPANSNVTLITFATDAKVVATVHVKDKQGRRQLRDAVGK